VRVITLTTDFGLSDWFVGTMKGVIFRINPRVTVVDLTHDLPAGDIRAGAFALAAACRFFPKGTVHVAVVDPGVGTDRKAIAVQTADYFFVGPDNGVLSVALRNEKIKTIRLLGNKDYFLKPLSQTFHGRDIFSPIAAELSCGLAIQRLGPAVHEFVRMPWPEPRSTRGKVEGEVVYIDHFGNAITNITITPSARPNSSRKTVAADVSRRTSLKPRQSAPTDVGGYPIQDLATCEIRALRRQVCPLKNSYQAVPSGKLVGVLGSSGFLEIAVNGGSAHERLGLKIGTRIILSATEG
jgi:S-adenosylmethionine hydrolase